MQGSPSELCRGRGLTRQSTGAWGEDLALRYLTRRGYTLVERNYRTRYGEIDLILRQGDALVFVEVKLRRGTGFGDPVEAVTARKQSTIRSLATQYLSDRDPDFETLRFDVIGILASDNRVRIRHVEDAF